VLLQGLYGVTEHMFVGVRFQDLRIKTVMDLSEVGSALGLALAPLELDHRTTSLGPALDYDTRDNQFAPSGGDYATLRIGFASPRLGSDVSYRNLHATWSRYWGVNADLVVAGRLSACAVDGNVPFTELCLYGTSSDLRGYTGGQYRDRNLYAAQAEARWRFAPRWGAVFFAGTGAVAPTFAELFSVRQLPAAGAGIRWLASAQYKVNVRLDVAVGRDGHAVYFSLGEAF
jgi:outer membrane translocation and assembly module TamA